MKGALINIHPCWDGTREEEGAQAAVIATLKESTVLACSYQATTDKFPSIYLDCIVK